MRSYKNKEKTEYKIGIIRKFTNVTEINVKTVLESNGENGIISKFNLKKKIIPRNSK